MSANAGQFSVSYLVPELQCQNWTVLWPFYPRTAQKVSAQTRQMSTQLWNNAAL